MYTVEFPLLIVAYARMHMLHACIDLQLLGHGCPAPILYSRNYLLSSYCSGYEVATYLESMYEQMHTRTNDFMLNCKIRDHE